MQETDRDQRPDDARPTPPGDEEPKPAEPPVIRLLANPRRIRRA